MDYLLFVAVLELGKKEDFLAFFKEEDFLFLLKFKGRGEADQGILDLLFIGEIKKEIFIALLPQKTEEKLQEEINYRWNIQHHYWGLTFSIPVVNVSGTSRNKEEIMDYDKSATLIVINEDETSNLVKEAKKFGAKGATVIYGEGESWSLDEEKAPFFISVEPDKNMVLILMDTREEDDFLENMKPWLEEKMAFYMSLPVRNMGGLTKMP